TDFDKETIRLVELAVAGHHKDFEELQNQLAFYETGDDFGILNTIDDRKSFSDAFNENVKINEVLTLLQEYKVGIADVKPQALARLIRQYVRTPYRPGTSNYFSVMILFGALKWCDHLGSAKVSTLFCLDNNDFQY